MTDPLSVVDATIEARDAARRRLGAHRAAHAWAVFDGDEHRGDANQQHRWNTAIQRAQAKGIRLAVSNPCFELWYLLHFRDQSAPIHRDIARHDLARFLGDYGKSDVLFTELEPKRPKAEERAARLCKTREDDVRAGYSTDPHANPSTRAHLLVAHILSMPQ